MPDIVRLETCFEVLGASLERGGSSPFVISQHHKFSNLLTALLVSPDLHIGVGGE